MKRIKPIGLAFLCGVVAACLLIVAIQEIDPSAHAAGGKVESPTGVAPDRYVYYPGTEELDRDEIRMVACGTGMPSARRSQAATCFLVELGDGQKFLFDIGSGSHANLEALMIPSDFLTKIFVTHLHTDHWGDLTSLWAGGWTAGRTTPLEVWGPSGARDDMGTKFAVEHMLKAYNWDYMTRAVTISPVPGEITVHEFDYKGVNQVVYQENGVTVRSWPAIHAGDGPISYSLEWNGYKIVIGGDTAPNKWFIQYAKDADLAVHEAFMTSDTMMAKYGQPAQLAARINLTFHTSAQAFGKIMSTVKPRHAVAYHFFNDEDTRYQVYDGIRETYDGPLSMATDMMVWHITRDTITERMAVSPDKAWDVPGPGKPLPPDRSRKSEYTDFTLKGRFDTSDVDARWLKEFMEEHDLTKEDLKVGE
ncbi:MAG: guanitoxin biosynthesis MBL fold metallo-hydrolase GntH [Planctomycetota bacterium]|jgi:ribonuclease Z